MQSKKRWDDGILASEIGTKGYKDEIINSAV